MRGPGRAAGPVKLVSAVACPALGRPCGDFRHLVTVTISNLGCAILCKTVKGFSPNLIKFDECSTVQVMNASIGVSHLIAISSHVQPRKHRKRNSIWCSGVGIESIRRVASAFISIIRSTVWFISVSRATILAADQQSYPAFQTAAPNRASGRL